MGHIKLIFLNNTNDEMLVQCDSLLYEDGLSDLDAVLCRHFWRGNLWVPQDGNLPTCAPSGLEPLAYHILGRQTLSPRSNQLGNQRSNHQGNFLIETLYLIFSLIL